MSETSNNSGRRRRRPRRRRPTGEKTEKPTVEASKSKSDKSRTESSRSRRRRSDRRRGPRADSRPPRETQETQSDPAVPHVVHRQDESRLKVSPVDEGIFIYTYTLRPRSLLDNYQAGPSVAEKMLFEDGGSAPQEIPYQQDNF